MRYAIGMVSVIAAIFLCATEAAAHKPVVVGNPRASSIDQPYDLDDVAISQVAYHEVTASAPAIWFRFSGTAGQEVLIQGGVPRIARLADLRPIVALVGPGLPAADMPFALPPGLGALVFDSADEPDPTVFNEPFTGTVSWQFTAHTPTLSADGVYYAVGYLPPGETGKIWLTVGTIESFGLADILTLPAVLVRVRLFHEVFPLGGLIFWALLAMLALASAAAARLA